jgi:glutamine amidotransferase
MCELLGMSSNRQATVNLSLMKLAEHGGFSGPHRDGWGVAYYEGLDVRLIKEAEAAADSEWVRFIRDHDLRSHIVIAHVHRATMGERAYRNTQPFVRELAGHMDLFAHNGWLPGIFDSAAFRSKRFCPIGERDSEMAFCVLLDRMTELWDRPGEIPLLDARLSVVSSFAASLRCLGRRTFCIRMAMSCSHTAIAANTLKPPKWNPLDSFSCSVGVGAESPDSWQAAFPSMARIR